MREKEPEWRPSYLETVTVTLNAYLLVAFGNRRVGEITRADLLAQVPLDGHPLV